MISREKKMQSKLSSKELAKYILGREVDIFKQFSLNHEEFGNLHNATHYLFKKGYSYGSMSLQMPIAIQLGSDYKLPEKWYNLSEAQKKNVDGVMLSDDFRNGTVKILIFKNKN